MNRKLQRCFSVAMVTAAVSVWVAGSAPADVVWSEDWNPGNFAISGTVTDTPVGNLTDRSGWLNVSYNVFSSVAPADQHGWTFSGSDFLIINTTTGSPDQGAGALYLNECCNTGVTGGGGATASTTITGLTAGETYHLDFSSGATTAPTTACQPIPRTRDFMSSCRSAGGRRSPYAGVDQFPGSAAPRRRPGLHRDRADRNPSVQPVLLREFPAVADPRRFGRLDAGTVDLGYAGAWFRRARLCPVPPDTQRRGLASTGPGSIGAGAIHS